MELIRFEAGIEELPFETRQALGKVPLFRKLIMDAVTCWNNMKDFLNYWKVSSYMSLTFFYIHQLRNKRNRTVTPLYQNHVQQALSFIILNPKKRIRTTATVDNFKMSSQNVQERYWKH